MTSAQFRDVALSMPEAAESEHMGHPDFRVGGKIFATLGYPGMDHGMVILPPEDQERVVRAHKRIFSRAPGAWGKSGSTVVRLEAIEESLLREVMEIAWRKRSSPKRAKER